MWELDGKVWWEVDRAAGRQLLQWSRRERKRTWSNHYESKRWNGVPYNGKSLGRVKELVVRMSERDIDYTDEWGTGIRMTPAPERRLPGPGVFLLPTSASRESTSSQPQTNPYFSGRSKRDPELSIIALISSICNQLMCSIDCEIPDGRGQVL